MFKLLKLLFIVQFFVLTLAFANGGLLPRPITVNLGTVCGLWLGSNDDYADTVRSQAGANSLLAQPSDLTALENLTLRLESEYLRVRAQLLLKKYKKLEGTMAAVAPAPVRPEAQTLAQEWLTKIIKTLENTHCVNGLRHLVHSKMDISALIEVRSVDRQLYVFLNHIRFWFEIADAIYHYQDYVVFRKALMALVTMSLRQFSESGTQLPSGWKFAHLLAKELRHKISFADFVSVALVPEFTDTMVRARKEPLAIPSVDQKNILRVVRGPLDSNNQPRFLILQENDPAPAAAIADLVGRGR